MLTIARTQSVDENSCSYTTKSRSSPAQAAESAPRWRAVSRNPVLASCLGARRATELEDVAREVADRGCHAVAVPGDVRDEDYAKALVAEAIGPLLSSRHRDEQCRHDRSDGRARIHEPGGLERHAGHESHRRVSRRPASDPGDVRTRGGFRPYSRPASSVTRSASRAWPRTVRARRASSASRSVSPPSFGAAGIRVNALLPGGTKTPMSGDFSGNPDAENQIGGFHALKRMAEPAEIARAALFLASDAASFVTGSAFVVDGGNSINKL